MVRLGVRKLLVATACAHLQVEEEVAGAARRTTSLRHGVTIAPSFAEVSQFGGERSVAGGGAPAAGPGSLAATWSGLAAGASVAGTPARSGWGGTMDARLGVNRSASSAPCR
jgi:hypothetical protein